MVDVLKHFLSSSDVTTDTMTKVVGGVSTKVSVRRAMILSRLLSVWKVAGIKILVLPLGRANRGEDV